MSSRSRLVLLLLALAPAACGDLPRPFEGQPGATARRLSQPPPARLVVSPPTEALLSEHDSATFSHAIVDALVAREVPAVSGYSTGGDWKLILSADLRGGRVVPHYVVRDPKGAEKGAIDGGPIDPRVWQSAAPAAFQQLAASAAPGIADLLTRIEAARQESDPNSLLNRPARLYVKPVTGAPGDGNGALTRNMRRELPPLGQTVTDNIADADFLVTGQVSASPNPDGTSAIEIRWIVTDAHGAERGNLTQLHDLPTALVNGLWGDVAVAAAHEAADGVREVLRQQLPRRPSPPPA